MHKNRNGIKKKRLEKMGLVVFLLMCICTFTAFSQNDKRSKRGKPTIASMVAAPKAKPQKEDTLTAAQKDSISRADSLFKADSLSMLEKSSLDAPAFTAAKDSIVEDFSNGKRMIYYYGDVSVTYGNMKLSADYMEYDLKSGTLYARGTKDSTGVIKGQPTMEQGGKSYSMEEVRYNFNTQKARITNMVTQEADGLLHGKNIKMMPDRSINITNGKYTVCDCEHPHYYLHLTAAKVITKPSQKTVFGPAYPVIEDVPLPIGLPFGFIPKRPDRATGILFPTFGEEMARGFYMRDLGMYFVLGDYFDIAITGDIYTLGSWGLNVNSRYKVNYKFNGGFGLTLSNVVRGEKGSSDFLESRDFSIRWQHSQDPKARPGTSFSADVNFSSPMSNRYNSQSLEEALQSQISSSISYGKNWNGKFNLTLNLRHSQNNRDSTYSLKLPDISFSISRFYPFKQKQRVGKEKFYEKFSLSYNTSFQNNINFKSTEFGKPGFMDKFQSGMSHNFGIGLPNFSLFKYINVTPSVSYSMNWFFRKNEKVYNQAKGIVEMIEGKAFNHFGATHNYSGSIAMSTRLYGMFNFGKHRKLQAIRHVITPTINAQFSPEKGLHFNGWRTLTYTDKNGITRTEDYNIYAGQTGSYPSKGKTASLSLSIGNNLEAKVRDLKDTTGTGTKKIKLIDQLSINTGYNFLADSMNLNNISLSFNTSVFGKISINGGMTLDPYAILVDNNHRSGNRINRFAIQEGQGLVRLTGANLSLSYSLSGEGKMNGNVGTKDSGDAGAPANHYKRIYYHPVTGEYIPGGWLYYTNPNVPWSINLSYSYNYSRSYQYANGQVKTKHNHNQTLSFNGNVKLTPRLSLQLSTNFDIMSLKLAATTLSATYDLHCFNINFSWIPSGRFEQWSFRIQANAAALADLLKFKKSASHWDNGNF